ncbi:hypothetical protein [Erythrobacter sp. SD-21]|uniref:hypothetical protein n=1 Tax=Erythrobacter sp. SD-21 TaxID=161528 RepID=UPI000153F781|nr:hypothetical protein [Erythrobacter sp. SD-21]EDL49063.1 hypothetical protein ED21_20324 [Erythrobacter sp. SD-21]
MAGQKKPQRYGKNKGKAINTRWREAFIEALGQTSNVTKAARAAGIDPAAAYRERREQPKFYERWQAALCEGYDHLELEVLRRLREGDFVTEDGNKYDFASALRVLAAHRESVAKVRAQRVNTSVAEIRASIDRKVEQIRQKVAAREKAQAGSA